MMKRVELINKLPNDLRQLVIYAEAAVYNVLRGCVDQVRSGEISYDQFETAVELLDRAVHPESVPVSERG